MNALAMLLVLLGIVFVFALCKACKKEEPERGERQAHHTGYEAGDWSDL